MAGVVALIVAGVGSAAISSQAPPDSLAADYQTISANYTGSQADGNADTSLDISRDFDREDLAKQAEDTKLQAQQLQTALSQLASKAQTRAEELELNQWVVPVAGYRLTGRFGQSSSLWSTVHTGLDFAGPSGTTIVSLAGGTVKSAGYSGAFGNRTVITLLDGTDVWYAHQSRITVSAGQTVDPGQVIGYTGSTGNVTGPHLHLEIRPGGGGPVAPYTALIAHGVQP
ncbi:MAG TPA: M23 family metallopeptidase [Aeromicrobium sp.]|nr:M23 family metallopeptidase [Aeromicrobium sp.]